MRPIVFLFTLMPLIAAAEVYSWKGADGKIHYSDQPPVVRGIDARKMSPLTSPPEEEAASARKSFVENETKAGKRRQQSRESVGKSEKEKSEQEEQQKNCRQAQAALKAIESGEIRFRINDKGEREALDGEVREAELSNARRSVAGWCK